MFSKVILMHLKGIIVTSPSFLGLEIKLTEHIIIGQYT